MVNVERPGGNRRRQRSLAVAGGGRLFWHVFCLLARSMLPRRDRPLVLVAVAQPELRAVLSHLFRDAHYDVLFAEDGVSVVTTAARSGPDAVVLDVELPRLDGLVALELLRAADDAVPAVILTAVSGPAILSAAERLHAAAVLRKPFRNADLLAAVARSLAEIPRPPSLTG